jgi:hypothetical protein
MKILFYILGISIFLLNPIQAQQRGPETWENHSQIFESELASFIEKSFSFKDDAPNLNREEQERRIQELIAISARISHVYMASLHMDQKNELDHGLQTSLKDYPEIRVFFYLLGNSLASEAQSLIQERAQTERQFKVWSTVGGSVLGLASGGALIYLRTPLTERAIGKVFTLAILTAGGGAIGYFGGQALEGFLIPVDPDVETAEDFLRKYPEGEDFIDQLSSFDADITDKLKELEEALDASL